jgi:transcriptional regulator with XRE-family HTH domain
MSISRRKESLIEQLKDKEYRDAFVSAHINVGIPFQIRALRDKAPWTQKELAENAGMKQSWISKIENPGYSGFSLKTLLKLASVFDVGLVVRFVPISELVEWELNLSNNSLLAAPFYKDPYFKEPTIETQAAGRPAGKERTMRTGYKAVVESGSCSMDRRRWEERATCGHLHRTIEAAMQCLAEKQISYCDHGKRAGAYCKHCGGWAQERNTSALWYNGRIHNQDGERISYCDHGKRAGAYCKHCGGWALQPNTSAVWYNGRIHRQDGERI